MMMRNRIRGHPYLPLFEAFSRCALLSLRAKMIEVGPVFAAEWSSMYYRTQHRHHVTRFLQPRYLPTLFYLLRAAVKEVWDLITDEYLQELVNSMQERCQAVIDANRMH